MPTHHNSRGNGKRVTLVLGAGGARGLAHIGAIEVLEEAGYEIAALSGTSMGALIGGIYAMGGLDTYRDWVCALEQTDVMRLLDLAFDQRGLFKGERIINVLRDLIGDADIETLPLPYTAVATDLDSQREVWFTRGPLFDAIRASIAIPTVFTPHEYRGMRLVDGGLVNPIPVPPTIDEATDLTIAVNVNGRATREPPLPVAHKAPAGRFEQYREVIERYLGRLGVPVAGDHQEELGLIDIATLSMEAMQGRIGRFRLAANTPDIVIEIPRNACRIFEFYRAAELIELGRRQTTLALEEFRQRG